MKLLRLFSGLAEDYQQLKKIDSFRRIRVYTGIALVIVGVIIFFFGIGASQSRVGKSRSVKLTMEAAGELVTQKAYCTNVQVIRNSREVFGVTVPFTQSQYIFSYDGVVEACIDFSQVDFQVKGKVITVTMPAVYIKSCAIDPESLEVYDESKNIFSPLKLNDMNASLEEWQKAAEETAIYNGILDDAAENAKVLLTAFLASGFDMSKYQVVWKEVR